MQRFLQRYLEGRYCALNIVYINRLTTVLAFEGENVMESVLRSLNLAEQAGNCNELCFGYYIAGVGFGIVGKNEKMAMEYFRRGGIENTT
jgi:hypothetical protein